MGWKEEVREKLREIGWWILVTLARFILDRLTSNPGGGKDNADKGSGGR